VTDVASSTLRCAGSSSGTSPDVTLTGNADFHNLTVNKGGGSCLQLASDVTVANDLTISTGKLAVGFRGSGDTVHVCPLRRWPLRCILRSCQG